MDTFQRVRIGRSPFYFILILALSSCTTSRAARAEIPSASQDRYGLRSTHRKLIDNRGDGFEDLYGARNVRTVLADVFYRGGANNKYNRYGSRDNRNPLPTIGLENLCRDGFDTAVYLYDTGYETAPKKVDCISRRDGKPNTLEYLQISPYNTKAVREALSIAYRKIKQRSAAPAYYHCWNGWHASGLISAYALRQFCGVSGEDAVKYWDLNTDGFNTEPSFEKIRKNIRTFVPFTDFVVTAEEREEICLPGTDPLR